MLHLPARTLHLSVSALLLPKLALKHPSLFCCSSFATSDTVLNSELQSALEGTTSGAAARLAARLGAVLAAAAATGLLLL